MKVLADIFIVSQCEIGSVDEGFDGKKAKIKIVQAIGKKM